MTTRDMLLPIMHPEHKSVTLTSKRSNFYEDCSLTMKRQRSTTSLAVNRSACDVLQGNRFNLHSNPVLSPSHNGSSRLDNIRRVSESSMQLVSDRDSRTRSGLETAPVASSSNTNVFLSNEGIEQPNLTSHFFGSNCRTGSSWSSVTSIARVRDVIQLLQTTTSTSTDVQSQEIIADQCCYLSCWSKINGIDYGKNCRPKSSAYLTLHQVTLTIVSSDGINIVSNAMNTHMFNIHIQEYGCLVLGNIFALLYRRKENNSFSYEGYLTDSSMKIGDTTFCQIIHTMNNHPHNVAVHCAAIVALQQYHLSVLVNRQSDSMKELQRSVLQNAQDMFLPSNIRRALKTIIDIVEKREILSLNSKM